MEFIICVYVYGLLFGVGTVISKYSCVLIRCSSYDYRDYCFMDFVTKNSARFVYFKCCCFIFVAEVGSP